MDGPDERLVLSEMACCWPWRWISDGILANDRTISPRQTDSDSSTISSQRESDDDPNRQQDSTQQKEPVASSPLPTVLITIPLPVEGPFSFFLSFFFFFCFPFFSCFAPFLPGWVASVVLSESSGCSSPDIWPSVYIRLRRPCRPTGPPSASGPSRTAPIDEPVQRTAFMTT